MNILGLISQLIGIKTLRLTLGMLALFSKSLDSKLLQINTAISNEKEIQSIQKGYDEQIITKSEWF